MAIGDFNAESSKLFYQDKTSFESDSIENLTSQFELQQVIKEQTHILDTSSSSVDLIFTHNQFVNRVWGSFVSIFKLPSLNIFYANFNLELVYNLHYICWR